jgi:hypothetical protein
MHLLATSKRRMSDGLERSYLTLARTYGDTYFRFFRTVPFVHADFQLAQTWSERNAKSVTACSIGDVNVEVQSEKANAKKGLRLDYYIMWNRETENQHGGAAQGLFHDSSKIHYIFNTIRTTVCSNRTVQSDHHQ